MASAGGKSTHRRQRLRGRALAGLYRAIHVSAPYRACFGARPVEGTDRLTHGRSVLRPRPRGHRAAVAPAGPFLVRPHTIHVAVGLSGARAEQAREGAHDGLAALLRGDPPRPPAVTGSVLTVTPSASWAIARAGAESTTSSPSCSASLIETSWDPPTKRCSWAPPLVPIRASKPPALCV